MHRHVEKREGNVLVLRENGDIKRTFKHYDKAFLLYKNFFTQKVPTNRTIQSPLRHVSASDDHLNLPRK